MAKEVDDTTQSDIWTHRFIVVALFVMWGIIIYYNSTSGTHIPTDLIAGLLGLVIAYYFKRGGSDGVKKTSP